MLTWYFFINTVLVIYGGTSRDRVPGFVTLFWDFTEREINHKK